MKTDVPGEDNLLKTLVKLEYILVVSIAFGLSYFLLDLPVLRG